MKKVSVVIPVYDNETSLELLFQELSDVETKLTEKDIQLELIFVDDGSTDKSLDILLKIKENKNSIKIVKLTRNFGAVHASKTGLQFVTGNCFVILAADLQDPPELILPLVEEWFRGSKFVICERNKRHDPILTKLFASFYYWLIRMFIIRNYPKHGYDLALMDRTLLPYIQKSSKNVNTPLLAYWLGFMPKSIYYERRKRIYGKSRWTFSKKLKFFIDSIFGFSIVPIRFISFLGILIALISFFYGFKIMISAFLGKTDVRGFASIVTLTSFLVGLVIVMLGIIGEYVWRIFDEVGKGPESVIDEVYE